MMNNRINKIWLPLVFFAVATAFISCSDKKENEKRPKADLQAKSLEALEEAQKEAVSAESNSGQISTVLSKEPEQDFKLAEDEFFSISYENKYNDLLVYIESAEGRKPCLQQDGSFYGNYQISADRRKVLFFTKTPVLKAERKMFLLDGDTGENKFLGEYNLSVMTDFDMSCFLYEEEAEDGHKQIFLIQLDDLQQKEEILWDIAQQEKLHDPGYGLRFFRSDIADADYKIRLSMDSYMAAEGYFSIGAKHVRTTFDATAQGELFYTYIDTLPSAKYLGKQD
ncbi:MAG: hypothetical protein IJU95_05795 [Treponema sp.]|nr:hypothetical protein [Treponema sp.]